MTTDCVFCKIITGEIPAEKVYETNQIVAFRDIRAQAPVHVVIATRNHIEKLTELKDNDAGLMGTLILAARDIATKEGIGQGFRLVANNGEDGGQSVFHIHFHLLGGRKMGWPPG